MWSSHKQTMVSAFDPSMTAGKDRHYGPVAQQGERRAANAEMQVRALPESLRPQKSTVPILIAAAVSRSGGTDDDAPTRAPNPKAAR